MQKMVSYRLDRRGEGGKDRTEGGSKKEAKLVRRPSLRRVRGKPSKPRSEREKQTISPV